MEAHAKAIRLAASSCLHRITKVIDLSVTSLLLLSFNIIYVSRVSFIITRRPAQGSWSRSGRNTASGMPT